MPEISVIVPVYRVEQYLNSCIDSILTQTFTDFELILIDDGSPDRCGDICDKYQKIDSIILGCKFGEEHSRQVRYPPVVIFQALGHFAQLSFDFDLTSKDEECERHQTSPLDRRIFIFQPTVQEICILIDQVVEADSHVAQGNDNVTAGHRVF